MTPTSNASAVRPIYFPQTFLPPDTLGCLQRVFRSISILHPGPEGGPEEMQLYVDSGFLDVMGPPAGAVPEGALRDYRQWGDRHHGGVGVVAAWGQGRSAWGMSGGEGTAFEIATAIRNGASPAGTPPAPSDPLREAVVFLQLAHAADRQEYQIRCSLNECDRRHDRLFDAIRGEARPAAAGAPSAALAGADHMSERMMAWTRLFLSGPCPAPVFVTHHPDAVEWLLERSPAPLRLSLAPLTGILQSAPAGDAPGDTDIVALLAALIRDPLNGTMLESVSDRSLPTVHIWPEIEPRVFLARVLRAEVPVRPGSCGVRVTPSSCRCRRAVILMYKLMKI